MHPPQRPEKCRGKPKAGNSKGVEMERAQTLQVMREKAVGKTAACGQFWAGKRECSSPLPHCPENGMRYLLPKSAATDQLLGAVCKVTS